MPDSIFTYIARDLLGKQVTGRLLASDAKSVEQKLYSKGLMPLSIRPFYVPAKPSTANANPPPKHAEKKATQKLDLAEGQTVDAAVTAPAAKRRTRQIFVSYSTHDVSFVESDLVPAVRATDFVPWYSLDSIRAADRWERSILQALEASEQFLVVMSPNAIKSEWVRIEVHWATEHRLGRIIPIMIADCDPWQLHMRLGNIQYIDYREHPNEALDKLITALQTIV